MAEVEVAEVPQSLHAIISILQNNCVRQTLVYPHICFYLHTPTLAHCIYFEILSIQIRHRIQIKVQFAHRLHIVRVWHTPWHKCFVFFIHIFTSYSS